MKDWRNVDVFEDVNSAENEQEIREQFGVYRMTLNYSCNFIYFMCTKNAHSSCCCQFRMRWDKRNGVLQSLREHNHHHQLAPKIHRENDIEEKVANREQILRKRNEQFENEAINWREKKVKYKIELTKLRNENKRINGENGQISEKVKNREAELFALQGENEAINEELRATKSELAIVKGELLKKQQITCKQEDRINFIKEGQKKYKEQLANIRKQSKEKIEQLVFKNKHLAKLQQCRQADRYRENSAKFQNLTNFDGDLGINLQPANDNAPINNENEGVNENSTGTVACFKKPMPKLILRTAPRNVLKRTIMNSCGLTNEGGNLAGNQQKAKKNRRE